MTLLSKLLSSGYIIAGTNDAHYLGYGALLYFATGGFYQYNFRITSPVLA